MKHRALFIVILLCTLCLCIAGGGLADEIPEYEPVEVSISVKLVIDAPGNLVGPGNWSYEIAVLAGDDAPETDQMTGIIDQDTPYGTIEIGPITFTEPGEYTYTVTLDGNIRNVDNDDPKELVIIIDDDGEGNLAAEENAPGVTFTNTYMAAGDAELSGRFDLLKTTEDGMGHTFSFTLSAADGTPMPECTRVSVHYDSGETGEKDIQFANIEYREAGTFEYTITGDTCDDGWMPTDGPIDVTVDVTDNGDGTLTATVFFSGKIAYRYDAEVTVDPKESGTKFGMVNLIKTTEDNRGHTFSFTLSADDGAPMPENAKANVSYFANETGEKVIPFEPIIYRAVGEYTYTITEDTTSYIEQRGWTVANNPLTVTVNVTDNGDGTLSAEILSGTITNRYDAEVTVDPTDVNTVFGELNVSKTTEDGLDQEFVFTLSADDGAPMPEDSQASVYYYAGETGTKIIPFGRIKYTEAGSYDYTISEVISSGGWTVMNSSLTVTVIVTDNGNGTLSASVDGGEITNEYNAVVTVDPSDIESTLGKIDLLRTTGDNRGHSFSFILSTDGDAPMPENAKANVSYFANETGEKVIPFEPIIYRAVGEYTYTITEDTTSYIEQRGWTVANNPLTVTVNVTDNGDGTLSAEILSGTITNRYDAEVTVDPTDPDTLFGELNVSRTTEDGNGHEFAFTLSAADGVPMPESSRVSVSYNANETGTKPIPFGEITYAAAGTYYYTIYEESCGSGWFPDNNPLFVTVTVNDNGNGTLNVSVDGGTIVYEYCPVPAQVNASATANPFGTVCVSKTTEDDRGHTFSFTLSADDGTPMPDCVQERVSFIAWETGEKEIPFGWITYTEAGTYEYTIEEESCGDGWTVTDSPVNVTVVVTDNGDGTLSAEVTGGTITYQYDAETTIDPADPETLFGGITVRRTTEDGNGHEFAFTLSADDGVPMPAGNQASVCYAAGETGTREIPFGEIRYTAAGYYYYMITEDTWDSGWSVTNTPVYVTVAVTDNGDGTLNASVAGGTITYEYIPEPVSADLSDGSSPAGVISVSKTTEDGREHGFGFILSAVDDAPMPDYFQTVVNYGAGETGEKIIPFGWITFTEAGTYEYTIDEESCDGGWNTTDSPLNVTVEVTDNGNGTLSAAVTGGTMTYRYDAEAIVDPAESGAEFGLFNLTRTTENGEGHMFSFALNAADGVPMPSTAQASVSYAAGETGTKAIPFGTITYTAAGMYEYTISEVQEDYTAVNGWSILNSPATVMVEVTDNGDGTLNAYVIGGEIKNEYNAGLTEDDPRTISASSGYKTYVCYTAETAGVYSIAVAADTGITTIVSIYAESDGELNELYTDYNSIDNLLFQAGETRYFSFRFADGYIDGTLSVQIEHIGSLTQLNENETATAVIEESKQAYFMFIPAESGNYSFTSLTDEDTYGILYRSADGRIIHILSNDDGGENTNFRLPFTAEAGEVVYLGVRLYDQPSGEFSVIVEPYEGLVTKPMTDSHVNQVYGQSSTLTVEASSGRGGVTWTWLRWEDGLYTLVDSAEGNSFTVPADIDKETKYACYVSDGTESYIHEFYVNPTDEFLDVHAADYNNNPSVPLGGSIDLTVTAVTASNMHSYQWFKTIETEYGGEIVVCMESIPGAVNDTYCVEGIEKATRYICRVTSPLNQAFQDVIFDVQVSCGITAEAATEQYTTVVAGSQATMRVHTETESSVPITYKWEKLRENGTWELIDGAEGDTYTAENIQRNSEYHCTVYNGYNFAGVDFLIYVENNVSAWAVNGGYDSIAAGESCEMAVNTHSDDADTEFSYQWYGPVSKDNEEGEAIAGATESVLAVSNVQHNAVYYCVVTDQNNFCNRVNFRISVESDLTAEASSDPWLYITIGDTAELSVNASCSAGEVFYQWYGPLTEWQNEYDADIIDGAVFATYQISQWKSPHDCYLCVVSDPYGNTIPVWFYAEVSSNLYAHSLDFNDWIPVGYGQGTTLAVEVESFGDVTYQWYRQTAINEYSSWLMPVEGGTGAELTVASVTEPVSYECLVTDSIGTAHTVAFHLFIDNELQITEDETEVYVRADAPAILSVIGSCISGEISYQWYTEVHDDYGNTAFRPLEGETGTTLVISRHESNGRRFCCKAQDMTGDIVTSNPFTIWVDNGFFAEAADRDVSAVPGGSVTMTVNTTSYDGEIDYTWYLDGNVVPGATGSSYTIENANRRAEYRCHVQDRFGNGTDVWFTLTIDNGFTASAAEEFLTVIPGQSAEMTVEASSNDGGEFSYQWVMYDPHYDENDDWQEWRQIDEATGSTYISEAIFEGTQFYCRVQDQYGNMRDVPFTVSIDNHLTVTSVQENMTAEPDGTVTMEAEAHCEVGSITYQWYRQVFDTDENGYKYESWVLIDGATETSYTSEAIAQPTQYCCNVQDEYGTGLSAYFYITVDNHFCAEAAETSLTAAPNETATMQVSAECMKGGLSYQWYKYDPYTDEDNIWHEFRQIEGVTDATCISEAITQYTYYRCDVRDDYGNMTSVEFYISIDNHLTVTVEQNNLTAAPNEQVTMTVNAQCDVGTLSYQWYKFDPNSNEYGNWNESMLIEEATEAAYTSEPITGYTGYHCIIHDEYGCETYVDFYVAVENHFTASAVQQSQLVIPNTSATMEVEASCDVGSISYQWHGFEPWVDEWGNECEIQIPIDGATEAVYISEPITGYTHYYCHVQDECGNAIGVEFFASIDNQFSAEAIEPDKTVAPNEPVTLEVNAYCAAGNISYQWYQYISGDDYWVTQVIEGATGASYTIDEITKNSEYYCRVQDEYGSSKYVTFHILVENHFTAEAVQSSLKVPLNETATMEVNASCMEGDITYWWYKYERFTDDYGNWHEGFKRIRGAEGAAYTCEAITDNARYSCYVQDAYGNGASIDFHVTVDSHLTAEATASNLTATPNTSVSMEVTASCDVDPLTYVWMKYVRDVDEWGNEIGNWVLIEGATEAALTSEPITGYTMYRCFVQDAYGNMDDVWFYISIENNLTAEAFERNLVAAPDETVTMKVIAGCDVGTLTYQWYREEYYDIDGSHEREKLDETGAICEVAATRNVQYKCHVQDQYGGERDVWFTVTVENHFTAVAEQEDMYVAPNAAANMQVNAGCDKGRLAYQWYRPAYTDEDGSWHDNEVIEGVTGAMYTSDAITNYSRYYCRVNDEYGHIENVWFYIRVANHLTAEAVQDELTVNYNQTATLEVNASCDDNVLTYRWYRGNYVDEEGWYHYNELIEGAAGASYTTEPMTRFRWYYCDVLDQYGNQEQVSFNVTVENHFTAEAVQSHLTIQPGETASLEVRAGCDNGSVIYRWYRQEYDYQWGEWNIYPIDTEPDLAVYETEPLTRYAEYTCVATDQYGKEIYVEFSVSIDNHFTAGTNQEQEMEIIPGDEISMEVYASCASGSISYQWYKRGYDKLEGWSYAIPITGENGTAYTSDPVTEYTVYYCHVEDRYGNNVNIYFRLAIWDEPSYVWAKDFGSVRATRNGKGYSIPEQNESVVTTYQVTVSPTDEDPGKAVYTANFSNSAFAQQQKERTIPATGGMTKLFLPGQIRNIEEEAFAGGAFQVVVIPDSCTSIGSRAFADCPNLLYVRIPASVTSLADDAFAGCSQVIIDDQRGN